MCKATAADERAHVMCRRATRSTRVLGDDGVVATGAENAGPGNAPPPTVGQKRTQGGQALRRSTRTTSAQAAAVSDAVMSLTAETEAKLCTAINDMLVEQRYVDEWKVEGVARWLQESKAMTVSEALLESYFDRVDQNMPDTVPHVLYDIAEKTVHRDY
jgi:hypothetical protein